MRNLEGSGWMTKPDLSIIEAKEGDPALPYTFTLSVMLANPNAPKDENGDGVPDAPAANATDAATAAPAATSPPAGNTAPAAGKPAVTTPAPVPAPPAATPAKPASAGVAP
jgi:type IV pilus assembly protein PilN